MASSSDLVKAPTVAATRKGPQALLKSCARLGEAAGVAPSVVHTILEHVQKLTVDALQQLKPFALHGVATFTRRLTYLLKFWYHVGKLEFLFWMTPAEGRRVLAEGCRLEPLVPSEGLA